MAQAVYIRFLCVIFELYLTVVHTTYWFKSSMEYPNFLVNENGQFRGFPSQILLHLSPITMLSLVCVRYKAVKGYRRISHFI